MSPGLHYGEAFDRNVVICPSIDSHLKWPRQLQCRLEKSGGLMFSPGLLHHSNHQYNYKRSICWRRSAFDRTVFDGCLLLEVFPLTCCKYEFETLVIVSSSVFSSAFFSYHSIYLQDHIFSPLRVWSQQPSSNVFHISAWWASMAPHTPLPHFLIIALSPVPADTAML